MDLVMPRDDLTTLLNSILTQIGDLRDDVKELNKKQDNQSSKLQSIEVQTTKTNGRVTKLEKSKNLWSGISTNTWYLMALAFVIILIISANVMKINLGGLI